MSGLQRHTHHRPCDNCGHGRCYHDRERVVPDDGPPGAWHWVYTDCPTGSGTFE